MKSLLEYARVTRHNRMRRGEWITLKQAKKIAAESILQGFRDTKEAREYLELFDNDLNLFTAEGFPFDKAVLTQSIEFAEQESKKPHFIAMAGMRGYLPNICEAFETRMQAIDFLVTAHDKQRGLRYDLVNFGDSERCFGNEYCEVTPCECGNIKIHCSDSL